MVASRMAAMESLTSKFSSGVAASTEYAKSRMPARLLQRLVGQAVNHSFCLCKCKNRLISTPPGSFPVSANPFATNISATRRFSA